MRNNFTKQRYIQATTPSTIRPGLPLFTKPITKRITVSLVNYEFDIPGATRWDPEELVSTLIVTGETGTTPTVDFIWEENDDPLDDFTQINQPAGLTANGTSLIVDSAANIPNAVFPVLLAQFTADAAGKRRLTKYEWCLCTGKSSNTLTLEREFYQDGTTFSDRDFVFFSNNWTSMRNSSGNVIQNAAVNIDNATAIAPVTSRLALGSAGLSGLTKRCWRSSTAPTSGNATYRVDLGGRTRDV
jgi:hypothetical protein